MYSLLAIVALFLLAGCATIDELFDRDQDVPPEDLPAAVITAAQETVPGLEIKEAAIKSMDGATFYEVEGESDGLQHELHITAEGQLLRHRSDD